MDDFKAAKIAKRVQTNYQFVLKCTYSRVRNRRRAENKRRAWKI